jgi:hypothetical protein
MSVTYGGDKITFDDGSSIASGLTHFRNRIINGAMEIDQRNAGAAVTTSGSYPVDRFAVAHSGNPTFSLQQISDAPTGFVNSMRWTTTNATGAYDFSLITQTIEGTNISDLAWGSANAKTVTLSFWTKSSLTGTFGGALNNSDSTRLYPFTYTISAANTWEYKTVTITGDISGTWLTTTGRGINVRWQMGSTSTYTGTNNIWQTVSAKYAASGCVQILETLNATWQVAGVQLELGSYATTFERRPYGTELNLCLRYYYKLGGTSLFTVSNGAGMGVGRCTTTTGASVTIPFPVPMRARPSALEQSGTASDYIVAHRTSETQCSSVPAFSDTTQVAGRVNMTVASGLNAGDSCLGGAFNTSAFFAWSAEL